MSYFKLQDVIDFQKTIETKWDNKDDEFSEYYELLNNMKENEINWISQYTACSEKITSSDLITHIANMDVKEINKEVSENFYNQNVMNSVACLADSIFYSDIPNGIANYERIKTYITKLRQIGDFSVSGVALESNLINPNGTNDDKGDKVADDLFVIKTPKDLTINIELIHETFIGFFGTNRLRRKIPNFAYVFAAFKCSAPIIINEEVLTYCNNETNETYMYVVYENIKGKSMKDHLETMTAEKFMNYYLQILFSLKIANREISFTHYDLHYSNVILRPYNSNFLIKYDDNYFETDMIATIIDYGRSFIQVKDTDNKVYNCGLPSNFEDRGVFNQSFIIQDVYKFLGFCLYKLKRNNPNVYTQVKSLITYFNGNENVDDIIENQRGYFYKVPVNDMTVNFDIDKFINYCIEFIDINKWKNPVLSNIKKNDKILQCDKLCHNFNEVLLEMGIDLDEKFVIPNTLFEFYDAYTHFVDEKINYKKFLIAFTKGYTSKTSYLNKATEYETIKLDNLMKNLKYDEYILQKTPMLIISDKIKLDKFIKQSAIIINNRHAIDLSVNIMKKIIDIYDLKKSSDLNKLRIKYTNILKEHPIIGEKNYNIISDIITKAAEIFNPMKFKKDPKIMSIFMTTYDKDSNERKYISLFYNLYQNL